MEAVGKLPQKERLDIIGKKLSVHMDGMQSEQHNQTKQISRAEDKVAKGLESAQADDAQALQINKEQSDDIAVAEAALAAAQAALHRAKANNEAQRKVLQQGKSEK